MNPANLQPDDPRLTSLVLGELPPDDVVAIRQAANADPGLQAELEEIESANRFLHQQLALPGATLDAARREAVLRAAREAPAAGRITPITTGGRLGLRLWLALAAAAAVVTLLVTWNPSDQDRPSVADVPSRPAPPEDLSFEVSLLPVQGPPVEQDAAPSSVQVNPARLAKAADFRTKAMEQKGELFLKQLSEKVSSLPLPQENELPRLRQREELAAQAHPSLQLPVQAGVSSLIWISRMIREDGKLPPANAVRIEEMLNRFALRPSGSAAVSKGVSLTVETTTCPWKPSACLMLVSFRGAAEEARDVKARFMAHPENVRSYRLIGFSSVSGWDAAPMPTQLPARTITSVVVEIDPATPAADLGAIEWSVDGASAPGLSLVRSAEAEPSNDARFAALVCAYGQWLAGQEGKFIDKEMLAAMARENFSPDLTPDRIDFLNLVGQSLSL